MGTTATPNHPGHVRVIDKTVWHQTRAAAALYEHPDETYEAIRTELAAHEPAGDALARTMAQIATARVIAAHHDDIYCMAWAELYAHANEDIKAGLDQLLELCAERAGEQGDGQADDEQESDDAYAGEPYEPIDHYDIDDEGADDLTALMAQIDAEIEAADGINSLPPAGETHEADTDENVDTGETTSESDADDADDDDADDDDADGRDAADITLWTEGEEHAPYPIHVVLDELGNLKAQGEGIPELRALVAASLKHNQPDDAESDTADKVDKSDEADVTNDTDDTDDTSEEEARESDEGDVTAERDAPDIEQPAGGK